MYKRQPQSYPGSPLRQGDSGTAVFTLQRQLNRITKDYPFLGKLTVDGVFGSRMAATVRAFQKQFNLTADGVVGRQTWYKISYIYVSVKDLAELTSEGETSNGTLSDGTWGGSVLRVGSSGSAVEQLQFWLNTLAQYESSIPSVTVDGVYGSGTAGAVRAFQRRYGLSVDGVVGRATWTELYNQFRSIQSDNGRPNAYPGTALRQGCARPHGVSQPEHPDRRWEIRRRHGGGSAEIPELLRPDQRRRGGPRHLEQAV